VTISNLTKLRGAHSSARDGALQEPSDLPGVGRCALFRGLSIDERREVQCAATLQQFEPGVLIVKQGEPVNALSLVISGRAKESEVRHPPSDSAVRLLEPGDLCGWPSVLTDELSPAAVRALQPTRALVWSRAAFEGFFERLPAVSRNALRLLAVRLGEQEERYRELAIERVPQRLARTLLRLVRPTGRRQTDPLLTDVPLSRAELAQMTGTTLFTVSRVVSQWEDRGLVEAHRGGLIVTNISALEGIGTGVGDAGVPE
jgi:CRP/FNR family transcriptional regulator, nitrogen oxide reductase regulator